MQLSFYPTHYGFKWTDDWYEFDRKAAHSAAMKARNEKAKELKKLGYKVKKWSSPNSILSMGGIGSGYPHIDVVCTCYALNAERE